MGAFSFDTIKDFDAHIKQSVSNYDIIFDLVQKISTYFIIPNTNVYDLGCSTGLMLKKLATSTLVNASFTGYDISSNLLPNIHTPEFSCYKRDITDDSLKLYNTNLILSIFTLQFIDVNKRHKLVQKIYDSLNIGGAFIVAEKVYASSSQMQEIFTFCHYDQKLEYFTEEEILHKQRDLRLIMRPLSVRENEDMFLDCGFNKIDTFYKSLSFQGWLLIK